MKNILKIVLLSSIIFTVNICFANNSFKINYTDDRKELSHEEFKWLGEVHNISNQKCSGTLVSPRIVLTAGHCVKDNPKANFIFDIIGPYGWVNAIVIDYLFKDTGDSPDWAILQLEKPIYFDTYPEVVAMDDYKNDFKKGVVKFDALGYPKDMREAAIHESCKSLSKKIKKNNLISTWCDLYPGMSGGPMLISGSNKIIGINVAARSGHFIMQNTGVFFSLDTIMNTINALREEDF